MKVAGAASRRGLGRKREEGLGVPLRLRLPNAPPVFVGRARERLHLLAALDRGPVTLVCGQGGFGKTSLVRSALHRPAPEGGRRVLSFSASLGDRSGEQLGLEILAALSQMFGGGRLDRSATADRGAFVAACVDLADALDLVIVLDDLHFIEGALIRELLEGAAAYARKSRWVGIARAEMEVRGTDGQSISLGPMCDDDLAALARSWMAQPSHEQALDAARDAGGSPFWLKQRLALGNGDPSSAASLVRDLDAQARAWLRKLAWLEVPLPEGGVRLLGDAPSARQLVELERRGLLERLPDGLRLHTVARAVLLDRTSVEDEAVAGSLAAAEGVLALVLESIRLDMIGGRTERAVATATRRWAAIVAAGLAPRLWQVIEGCSDPRLLSPKLACALDLGGGALGWALEQPAPAEPRARLCWLESLAQSPRKREAASGARSLASETAAEDKALAASALLLAARVLVSLGSAADAIAATDAARALAAGEREVEARADVWAARAHVLLGNNREALQLAVGLEARLSGLGAAARCEVEDQRGTVFANLGRTRRARDTFLRARRGGLVSIEQLGVQTRLVRGSLFAMELGDLAEARRLLDELGPVARRSDDLAAFQRLNELRYQAALGDLARADEHLSALRRAVSTSQSGYWSAWVASAEHYVDVLGARPVEEAAGSGPGFPLGRALAAWHEVRAAGTSGKLRAEPDSDIIDAAIALSLARASEATLRGDARGAVAAARSAEALAEEEGLVLWRADALTVLAEVMVVLSPEGLEVTAARLATVAESLTGSRYADEACFFRELSRGADADLAVFDRLALGRGACAPARRSRAILGREAPLDRIDLEVIARARTLLPHPNVVARGHDGRAGLGLDTRRGRVWLPRGASIDLSRKPVAMKILASLFEGGGRASKEELATRVWGMADYHPLRDDKRLQVAVSRLRVLLEDESLVETTEEGYRLAPEVPAYVV